MFWTFSDIFPGICGGYLEIDEIFEVNKTKTFLLRCEHEKFDKLSKIKSFLILETEKWYKISA